MEKLAFRVIAIILGLLGAFWIGKFLKNRDRKADAENVNREDLLQRLFQRYSNEHFKYIKWSVILLGIVFIVSLFYPEMRNGAYGLFFLWLFLIFPFLLLTIIVRKRKLKKIQAILMSNPPPSIVASQTLNSLIIEIDKKSIEIPHVYLPFSKDKCIEIINEPTNE